MRLRSQDFFRSGSVLDEAAGLHITADSPPDQRSGEGDSSTEKRMRADPSPSSTKERVAEDNSFSSGRSRLAGPSRDLVDRHRYVRLRGQEPPVLGGRIKN